MQITNDQIIALLSALLPFLVAAAGMVYNNVLARLPANKQALVLSLATQAVHASEQLIGSGNGTAKKKIAEDAINTALKSLGVKVDPALVNSALEATVFKLNDQAPHLVIKPVDTNTVSG